MITKIVIDGLIGSRKLKIWYDLYAGKLSLLKIQDLKTHGFITRYENHEWIMNKLPIHDVQTLIQEIIHNSLT